MPGDGYVRYSKALDLRAVDPRADAATLIRFGRDLYRESLGVEAAFFRDYGRHGAGFPLWVGSCAAANPDFAQFLVEEGRDIGLCVMGRARCDGEIGRLHHFYIAPTHRGRGFGGLLEDCVRRALKESGARRARLNVAARNERAIRFYDGLGWRETERCGGLIFMETPL